MAVALLGHWQPCIQQDEAFKSSFMILEMVSPAQRLSNDSMTNGISDPNFGDPNARPAIALIPLALSERGIRAIEGAGVPRLIEDVLAGSRPIHTRMVHSADENGNLVDIPMPYGPNGEVIRFKTDWKTHMTFYSASISYLEKELQNVFC